MQTTISHENLDHFAAMNVEVSIDSVEYDAKPDEDVATITQRLTRQSGTVAELAAEIIKGRTWSGGIFNGTRKNENWVRQQVFALDIDNEREEVTGKNKKKGAITPNDSDYMTPDRVWAIFNDHAIRPAFGYTSFSNRTGMHDKFRVVFVLPMPITDMRSRTVIQLALMRVLGGAADPATKDAARIWFGGKEIIYPDYDATLNIRSLIDAVVETIAAEDEQHAAGNIKRWCQSVGLNMINGLPAVTEDDQEICVNGTAHYNYIYNDCSHTHTFSFAEVRKVTQAGEAKYYAPTNEKREIELLRDVDWAELEETCEVYRDHMAGIKVDHKVTLFMISNLVRIMGGETRFFEGLQRREVYDLDQWKKTARFVRKRGYLPTYDFIKDFYPNAGENGRSLYHEAKAQKGKIRMTHTIESKTLEQAEMELTAAFTRAIEAEDTRVYVIKAPAGIGKTKMMLAQRYADVVIAAPTHDLKDEIALRAKQAGHAPQVTPRIPDGPYTDTIERLYAIGAPREAAKALRRLSAQSEGLDGYIRALDGLKAHGMTITTHARLPYLRTAARTLIIDEDITATLVSQSSVTLDDLPRMVDQFRPRATFGKPKRSPLYEALRGIADAVERSPVELLHEMRPVSVNFKELVAKLRPNSTGTEHEALQVVTDAIEPEIAKNKSISSNVLAFLTCTHYIRDNDTIYFVNRRNLPKDKKIIILSATANEKIYRLLFGDRLVFEDIGYVAPVGRVIQHPTRSYSRNSIGANESKYRELLEDLAYRGFGIITFKKHKTMNGAVVATFGAVEGIDALKGKKLAIVGTPHLAPKAYLLIAAALGIPLVGVQDSSAMEYRIIERNGFEFRFMVFTFNEDLREIQLHFIESQIEQSIGRARVLREDTVVEVHNTFPTRGVQLYPSVA